MLVYLVYCLMTVLTIRQSPGIREPMNCIVMKKAGGRRPPAHEFRRGVDDLLGLVVVFVDGRLWFR